MSYSLCRPGWERCWPDPFRARFLQYEPKAVAIGKRLGPAVVAEYLASAWVSEEELSEGRGDSGRYVRALAKVEALEAEGLLLW